MRVSQLAFTSLLCVCYVLGAMAGLCIVVGDSLLSMVRVYLGIQAVQICRAECEQCLLHHTLAKECQGPAQLHHPSLGQRALQGRHLLRQREKLFLQSRQALLPPVQHTNGASGPAAALVPVLVLGDSG